jgi:SP family sugar:H+ symporter-like MFS transporter
LCKSQYKISASSIVTNQYFSFSMIYETKGLSLEQVDELYGVVGKAWKSKNFVPQISFADVDQKAQRGMSLTEIGENQTRKRSVQHDEGVPVEKVV